MAGIPYRHAETFARLRRATEHLHALIESGEFHSYGYLKRRKLLRRVRKLYNQLAGPVAPSVLQGTVAAGGVLALAGCFPPVLDPDPGSVTSVQTPSFGSYQVNPFGLDRGSHAHYNSGFLAAADIDGDGDLDLFYLRHSYGEGEIAFQRNAGGGIFEPAVADPFGLEGTVYDFDGDRYLWRRVQPLTFVDIDGDGDLDLIVAGFEYTDTYYDGSWTSSYHEGLMLVENVGTSREPAFAEPVPFAANAGLPYNMIAAAFVDIDGDGDLDLVTASPDNVYLTLNTSGSPDSFAFADDSTIAFPYADLIFPDGFSIHGMAIVDLDRDGDLDLLVSGVVYESYYLETTTTATLLYFENTSTRVTVRFAEPVTNPFGISFPVRDWHSTYGWPSRPLSLIAADLDRDGDIDLLFGAFTYRYSEGFPVIALSGHGSNVAGPAFDISYYDVSEFFYFENKAVP